MQSSARARDADQRRGHVNQISINDPSHHVTDAIANLYGDNEWRAGDPRPFSFNPSPPKDEAPVRRMAYYEQSRSSPSQESALVRSLSDEQSARISNGSSDERNSRNASSGAASPTLSRTPSSDTAQHRFPLNDIDYESSPAAVAQELSNLQAIRRMSMNVDAADPDLPSFSPGGGLSISPPSTASDEEDPARLFWVPARLHPELAPKEFRTFVEDRVDLIRRNSKNEGGLSPPGSPDRSTSGSLHRRKSRLSQTIDGPGGYEDGAEVLERQRSQPNQHSRKKSETTLQELEHLVNDPVNAAYALGLERRGSLESDPDVILSGDIPVFPTGIGGQSLKRSTRTNYRRGSLRKGERVPPARRANVRLNDGDFDEPRSTSPKLPTLEDPVSPLIRVQTEPSPGSKDFPGGQTRPMHKRHPAQTVNAPALAEESLGAHVTSQQSQKIEGKYQPPQGSFHSRIATHGRTTATLPGYPGGPTVPQITETPPPLDSKNSRTGLPYTQELPERKSSHDFARANTMQTVPLERPPKRPDFTRTRSNNQTLDEMAKNPSLMPGTSTRTDALSFIPTFAEEKKPEKKSKDRKDADDSSSRKTSWGWLRGNDDKSKDKDKDKREKEEKESSKKAKSKITKMQDKSHDASRLDLLQSATESSRARESLVLDRETVKLDEDRKKDVGKKVTSHEGKKEKEAGLFSSFFGGGKKKADRDGTSKKTPTQRRTSPDPTYRLLRADIDYNWTRFSILEERAIYRMAHIKLANPRRALASQVLLSNFMYSYLAKVQQMHPQIPIPQYNPPKQQSRRQPEEAKQRDQQSDEFAQWQAYQNHHERVSYNLDGTTYDPPASNAQPYNHDNYIDDYDSGDSHHQQRDNDGWSYQQHHGNGYSNGNGGNGGSWDHHLHQPPSQGSQVQHWERRDGYAQHGVFGDARPPEEDDDDDEGLW